MTRVQRQRMSGIDRRVVKGGRDGRDARTTRGAYVRTSGPGIIMVQSVQTRTQHARSSTLRTAQHRRIPNNKNKNKVENNAAKYSRRFRSV